jgi:hypothetical protein
MPCPIDPYREECDSCHERSLVDAYWRNCVCGPCQEHRREQQRLARHGWQPVVIRATDEADVSEDERIEEWERLVLERYIYIQQMFKEVRSLFGMDAGESLEEEYDAWIPQAWIPSGVLYECNEVGMARCIRHTDIEDDNTRDGELW